MKNWQKYILLFTILILLVGCIIGIYIAMASSKSVWQPRQFTVSGGTPCLLQDGQVWKYTGEKRWEQVPLSQSVKQLLPGDTLWVVFQDGILYTPEPPVIKETMPLTGVFYTEMALQLLEISKTQPFSQISGNPSYWDVLVLRPDGTLLTLQADTYSPYALGETAIAVSGRYILTEQGNLYYLEENGTSSFCIHDKGGITAITTDVFDHAACLALTDDGQVLSFDRDWHRDPYDGSTMLAWTSLPTEDWHHVTTVAQGHNFAAGLTEQGKIVFTGILPAKSLAEIQKKLSGWRHIVSIAAYNTQLYGLQSDGKCICLELEPFLFNR